ncbi:MAG: hypothetical protein EXS63_08505 [Candidatus Omnitrophica bacterium]|nr:hypothetical protein [Candidatus Omnitrophota bacterium]
MINISWFIPETRMFPQWQKFDYNRVLPSVWIRCLQLIPQLEKLGIQSSVNEGSSKSQIAVFVRCFDERNMKRLKLLKSKQIRVFVDTPVNYFSESDHPAFEGSAKKYFNQMAAAADGIFCASRYIQQAGESKGFKTYYFPDTVDQEHFKEKKINVNLRHPVLMWSGNSTKASALNFLAPMIRGSEYHFLILSDRKPRLDFPFEFIRWSYQDFPKQLLRGDLGIFPRDADNEYDQGHSFFKIGVCLALHIPVIYSAVPSYEEVANASNSVKVTERSAAAWERAIKTLSKPFDFQNNPVENEYSLKAVSEKYASFFHQAVEVPNQVLISQQ